MARAIGPDERLGAVGGRTMLRLVALSDVGERYLGWLRDPEVNRYLETRFAEQSLESIAAFVSSMIDSPHSYLFAILDGPTSRHVGNVKIGPINHHHSFADVSYFLGDRDTWGRGLATEAVRLVTQFGFERLGLHRCQAGVYASHAGSRRVLEKAGYREEGSLAAQLRRDDVWEDHVWYGALREIWQ